MEKNDGAPKQNEAHESAGQNPTLNSPGSQVADYGNTTGGSAVEDKGQSRDVRREQPGNETLAADK